MITLEKRKRSLPLEVAERFELPAQALSGVAKLTITGARRAVIEDHKGLLALEEDLVAVDGGRVTIRLHGEGLQLRAMDKSELVITGEIFSAEFE